MHPFNWETPRQAASPESPPLTAARNWSAAHTATRFLLTATTIADWLKRLDDQGPDALVQLPQPVNRFPDFVAHIVQTLKSLCPTMGRRRIADTLARAGLHMSATTARRMIDRPPTPVPDAPTTAPANGASRVVPSTPGRTVTARYPDHVWNIDLTVVPTAAGLWIPMFPGSLLQRWPFAWWVAIVLDHASRSVVGLEVFSSQPSADQLCFALERIVATTGRTPKYTVTAQGPQFQAAYPTWCDSHGIKPRFGAVGKHGSIAVLERFILSMKNEALRRTLIPLRIADMRVEVARFVGWYNEHRPHSSLRGATPAEVLRGERPANRKPRLEPRAQFPANGKTSAPQTRTRGKPGCALRLVVTHHEGASHLPIVSIRKAA